MLNKYPLWKNLLIIASVAISTVYVLPNLYSPDPALQISGESSAEVIDTKVLAKLTAALDEAGVAYFGAEAANNRLLVRFADQDLQLQAKSLVQQALGDDYVVALNLAANTPGWLLAIGAEPLKLGLDLSGGVHFLLEVDTDAMIATRMEDTLSEIRRSFRKDDIKADLQRVEDTLLIGFDSAVERSAGATVIANQFGQLTALQEDGGGKFNIRLTMPEAAIKEIQDYAVKQNLTTLRNRVNELGVAEPLVQRQGANRIVVELPGIQDTAAAKRILGKTASLEFRLEAATDDATFSREQLPSRNNSYGTPWVQKKVIVTGERVSNAQSGFDENSRPQVSITLDTQGGTMMHRVTRKNIQHRMAVIFIERKNRTVGYEKGPNGREIPIYESYDNREVINLATIQSALGTSFRITGLDSPAEAAELALLLRAGALAAPVDFVEERTVGPSLGAENIAQGVFSVEIGMALVVIFMLLVYKVFGIAASLALAANLVILLALLSILSATLTLPGIAGIVLTLGMAVDANVLIYSRIREELANNMPAQQAIDAGYARAFITILDANLTTLIVAVILYAVGTGPTKGFAVTLSLGLITSQFTAIMVSRMVINGIYGGRNVNKLWI